MNRRTLLTVPALALITLIANPSSANAQDKPNFSGSWKMNADKSDFGPVPKPSRFERTITHNGNELAAKTTQAGDQGERTTELKYKTDGSDSINKINGQDVKSVAAWEGAKLVVRSKREIQGMEISQVETWALSGDGKVITVDNEIDTPQGKFAVTIVLDKQ
ncbi:hypothetical protein F183_A51900 [Bryobacterales bacterium F-183]|nr:hypothetical protein F183_A51900 [Bryobacterales bacterium F-183]